MRLAVEEILENDSHSRRLVSIPHVFRVPWLNHLGRKIIFLIHGERKQAERNLTIYEIPKTGRKGGRWM